jgi:hypothetical protein
MDMTDFMYTVKDPKTGNTVSYTVPESLPGDGGYTSVVYINGAPYTTFKMFVGEHDTVTWVDEDGNALTTREHKQFICNLAGKALNRGRA